MAVGLTASDTLAWSHVQKKETLKLQSAISFLERRRRTAWWTVVISSFHAGLYSSVAANTFSMKSDWVVVQATGITVCHSSFYIKTAPLWSLSNFAETPAKTRTAPSATSALHMWLIRSYSTSCTDLRDREFSVCHPAVAYMFRSVLKTSLFSVLRIIDKVFHWG